MLAVLSALLALLVTGSAAASVTTASDEQREARIIGGRRMEEGDIPYQVSIRMKDESAQCSDQHFCGGSIISLDTVLTAGHCMRRPMMGDTDPKTICIIAGTVRLKAVSDNATSRVERDVLRVHVHEDYSPLSTSGHDIAALKLASPLPTTNPNVRIIPLQTEDVAKDNWCFVSGWGLTSETSSTDNLPQILMGVHVPFIPSNLCRDQYYQCRIHDDEICAGLAHGGKDACQGDSGGPFVCSSMLTGVVSWGVGCGRKSYPGVYASVKHYRSWIMDKINLPSHAAPAAARSNLKESADGSLRQRCSG